MSGGESEHESEQRQVERELGGRYQIVRALGRGASGAVYLARERQLHRIVAIKVLRAEHAWSEAERARLRQEARTVANLMHPGIIPLLAFGETATAAYMVMPYVGGETLADRLEREQRIPPEETRVYLAELAAALGYAHREGVVHRDLKPENVLLVSDGERTRPVLVDFGIAAFPSRDLGVGGVRENAGTVHFMSPEQALGETELDGRSDLFALGALGYLMLAGSVPFDGPSAAVIIARLCAGERVPLKLAAPEAPADLVAAIDKCLETNPTERWQRAGELRDALEQGTAGPRGVLGAISTGARQSGARRGGERGASSRRSQRRARGSARVAAEMRGAHRSHVPRMFAGLGGDVRFAVRTLRKTPGFTAAVIVTLALGLGATTTVFSAVEALLLRELPVADPASLVILHEVRDGPNSDISFGASVFRYDRYLAYRVATASVLSGLGAQTYQSLSVRLGDQARPVSGLVTSGNYFELLGVRPARGRFYTAAEDEPGGAEPVVVVGYDFWQRVLGGNPKAVGQTLWVDSRPLTIIGVAPRGFNGAFAAVFDFDVWVPAAAYERPPPAVAGGGASSGPSNLWLNLFGRLRPGVDIEDASAALRVTGPRVPTANPDTRVTDAFVGELTALPLALQKPVEHYMAMLLAMAGAVLLLAAANAAGMLLARGAARRHEVATRLAVGASRAQLVRQLLVESTLLCAAAGIVGLLLTWWSMRAVNMWRTPFPLQTAITFGVNGVVLAVAAATVLGASLLSGLAPALQTTRVDLASSMKEGGMRAGTRRTRLRNVFVVAQVALSVILLAVAGLFVQSLRHALVIDPGFDAQGVVHATMHFRPHGYNQERAAALYAQLLERLRARPEVLAAALANRAPLTATTSEDTVRTDGPDPHAVYAAWGQAGVGFMELLRVPLLAGRTFASTDDANAPRVTVINQTLAQRLWPGAGPGEVVGRELEKISGVRMTVVGVMGNGKYITMQERARSFAYVPFAQDFTLSPWLYIRARGDPAAALQAAREELARLDPNIALERPTLATADIDSYLLGYRVEALLVMSFGLVGLVLAMTGLYGVLAFGVAQRQREFGVRIALGARTGDVVRLVVRHGLGLVALGIVIGLAGAVVAGRLVAGFLYGVSPVDALTLVAVPLVLVAVALLASAIPARRAAAADPMTSLRAE